MDARDLSQVRFTPTYKSSSLRRRVPGLREEAPPSDVKVYKLNADGSKGKFLRTEPAFPTNTSKRWVTPSVNY